MSEIWHYNGRVSTHKAVNGGVCLIFEATTLGFAVLDGSIDETGVARFVGGGQDQRRIGGGVLEHNVDRRSYQGEDR